MAFTASRVSREQVRSDVRRRLARLRSKRWHVLQAAGAAGMAWFIAAGLLGHVQPVFAPIAAVVSLGTSYGQRLRRVTEVTIGVALGVFLGDVVVQIIGEGAWQMTLVVAMAMVVGIFISSGQVFRNQAAVQSIFVMGLLPTPGAAFTRWTDALIGGAVALVAASIVPAAPLRRPGEQAAVVAKKIASLLRAGGQVMLDADAVYGLKVLADARATDPLIRELQDAAEEGMSVLTSSPFRFRHRSHVHRVAELVEPLDRALRSTRVMVRRAAVSAYRGDIVPQDYYRLAFGIADAVDVVEAELAAGRSPDGLSEEARAVLLHIGEQTGLVQRSDSLNAEVILVQLRSIIVDLLGVTGMGQFEATDALPPLPPRGS